MSKGLLVSGVLLLTVLAGAGLRAGQAPPGASASAPSVAVGATAQAPTFKAAIEYIEVDVVVTDGQGKPVRDLTRDDFQVFEDGKRQDISNFAVVNIPIQPPGSQQSPTSVVVADTTNNERPFSGRLYVVVLDDLYVTFMRSLHVRNAAKQFIERNLSTHDLMAIVSTGGPSNWSQEFTSNKRLLLEAVDRFTGQKPGSAVAELNDAYIRQSGNADASRGLSTVDRTLLDVAGNPDQADGQVTQIRWAKTMTKVADWFGGIRGRRKTMLLFSEGLPYDTKQLLGQDALRSTGANSAFEGMQGAIAAATRANISIYTIDPRGLTGMPDGDIAVSSLANEPSLGLGQAGLNDELRQAQQSLRIVSEETGGFAVINTNQYANAFDRIVGDNSTYYLLSYYPPSIKRDGTFHKIEVKTTRRGVTVRSRKGYQSPRGNAPTATPASGAGRRSPALQEALDSPIPFSGLPMRMFAAPFKGTARNASVLVGVELAGGPLTLAQNSTIEFSYVAVDAQGNTRVGATDSLTTRLTPESQARAQQSGLRILNRIALPPGWYAMRVAARDVAAGTTGSLTYDLEVPDFSTSALSMSGVLVTSMSGSAMVTVRGDDQAKAMLPTAPIATRTFPQNDEIGLFAEIYDNQTRAARPVTISTTIQSDDGRVLFSADDERDSSELLGSPGSYAFARRIPLNGVPPGAYVLRLQVTPRVGNDHGVDRQLRVVVTPPVVSTARSSSVAALTGSAAGISGANVSGNSDAADATALDADYGRVVAAYRRGDIVTAVAEVASWPEDRIRSARSGAKAASAAIARTLAMVHVEAAFALRPAGRADRHLAAAEAFIDALPDRDADGFIARWRVLAATYDVMLGRTTDAQVRLRRAPGHGVHSRHAALMLIAIQELSVRRQIGGRVRDEVVASVIVPSTGPVGLSGLEAGTSLAPAYARVVEEYPDFLAARLRWGWALYINRSPDARRPLEMVAAQATRPDLRYLAFLFLGAVAERENRLDDALRAYSSAVAAVPHQSALIGVLTVARVLGEQARVQQATRMLQALGPAAGDDPWNLYNVGVTGDELLAELRAAARQA